MQAEFPTAPTASTKAADAAARIVSHMVKTRARHYARRPMALETLYPGLANASADTLIAIAAHLVERESRSPRRWFGFGGEVNLINARAAALLGRALRRAETRDGTRMVRDQAPNGATLSRRP